MERKYVDNKIERKEVKKQFIKGFNKLSFTAVLYLLFTQFKKQWFLFLIIGLLTIVMFFGAWSTVKWNENYGDAYINAIIAIVFSFSMTIPLMLIAFFSIPSTLSGIQSSTMIKRIGATRVNEKSYILIVWVSYYALCFISLTSLFLFWIVFGAITGVLEYMNHIASFYLYLLLFIALIVSFSILIGISPINRVAHSAIGIILLLYFMIFSGVIGVLTFALYELAPWVTIVFTFLNPITASYYLSSQIINGAAATTEIVFGILYTIMLSLTFTMASMSLMSFNKIK